MVLQPWRARFLCNIMATWAFCSRFYEESNKYFYYWERDDFTIVIGFQRVPIRSHTSKFIGNVSHVSHSHGVIYIFKRKDYFPLNLWLNNFANVPSSRIVQISPDCQQ